VLRATEAHVAFLKDLTALGKDLGYKDAELNKCVSAQFKIAEDKSREEQQKEEEKVRSAEEREERLTDSKGGRKVSKRG